MNKILERTFQIGAALARALAESHARERESGYRAGYQKGWQDATAAITTAASKANVDILLDTPSEEVRLPGGTLREKIKAVALDQPGMRPTALARLMQAIEPGLNFNSILVTIKRMRETDFERRDDGTLHLIESDRRGEAA